MELELSAKIKFTGVTIFSYLIKSLGSNIKDKIINKAAVLIIIRMFLNDFETVGSVIL